MQTTADVKPGRELWAAEQTGLEELLAIVERSRPAFHSDAACRESHPGVTFFPERGEDARPAKEVCAGCLSLDDCRRWSFAQDASLQGVWGGLSRQERLKARRTVAVDPRLRVPSMWDDALPGPQDPAAADRASLAAELRAAGQPVNAIAATLGVSRQAVTRYLRTAA